MTGSGAQLNHMDRYLAKALQAEVILSDPLGQITVAPSIQDLVYADRMGSAPAIGLAMGGAS